MNDEFETLIGLVSQYSPSGQERGAVEWLVAQMKSLGYDDAFVDEAGNAVGVMGKGTKQVVLLGHIDTVPGEISVRVEDGVLYGRGSVDAKGPLASFVDAVAKVGAKDGWQFVVIGAIEEERNSEGARFVGAIQARFCDHWRAESMGPDGAWLQRQCVGKCDGQT